MKKLYYLIIPILYSVPQKLFAVPDAKSRLSGAAGVAGYENTTTPPQVIVLMIVKYLLGFIGLVFLGLMLYAGFQWMTSGGNEEKISKAKDRIKNTIIGIAIIISAYMITSYVAEVMTKSTCTGYYCYPAGGPSPCYGAATQSECLNIPGGYCAWDPGGARYQNSPQGCFQ